MSILPELLDVLAFDGIPVCLGVHLRFLGLHILVGLVQRNAGLAQCLQISLIMQQILINIVIQKFVHLRSSANFIICSGK